MRGCHNRYKLNRTCPCGTKIADWSKSGLCVKCGNRKNFLRWQKHSDKAKIYRATHKAERAAHSKRWRAANPDYAKQWRAANPDYDKQRREAHPDECAARTCYYNMVNRCYLPTCKRYKNYGARGIEVCLEWHYLEEFRPWYLAMGGGRGKILHRTNNDGNYCPENCVILNSQSEHTKHHRALQKNSPSYS